MKIYPVQPSQHFIEEYKFKNDNFDIFGSDESRCENVIYPILFEVCKKFVKEYSLWSHRSITADTKLMGTPDYMISTRSHLGKNVIGSPLVMIAVARQNDFIQGWGQCLAELVTAQRLNNSTEKTVYGCVTDGELWHFGKLEGDLFTRNQTSVTIAALESVFGALTEIMELAVQREAKTN
ncbi:MAG: hypothetical protein AAF639_40885 [Chloroflexota bacterium]